MPLLRILNRKNFPAIGFFLVAVIPLTIDVVLSVAGIHTGTPLTRLITGVLFGISMAWFVIPIFIEAYSQLYTRNNNRSSDPGAVQYVRKTQ